MPRLHTGCYCSVKLQMYIRLITAIYLIPIAIAGDVVEYCQQEKFTARCEDPNEVILMESARYGRMAIGRCVRQDLGYVGCAVDALPTLDAHCSGQPGGCEFSIMDPALRSLKPCPTDVTWHLEAAYTCIPVLTGSVHECHSRHHVTATDQSAYLSSAMAATTGIGSTSCPWQVRAAEGQRVNLTLLAFVDAQTPGSQKSCYDVAVIRDGSGRRGVTACSGQPRQQVILVSDTNTVELEFVATKMASEHVLPRPGPPAQFIIHYQFVGCANPAPPTGATISRDGDVLTVRCNLTGETWYLTCSRSRWIGSVGNCSTHATQTSWSSDELFGQAGSFPLGILIVVAVGVALGVFLGGTMLLLASMLMKRRQQRHDLGRCDGSEDLKPMEHDVIDVDHLQEYSCGSVGDPLRQHKHYVMPDYGVGKDYVIGATADVIRLNTTSGYDAEYPTESHDRIQPQQQQAVAAMQRVAGAGLTPRIHYHVYESPQMT